MSVQKTWLVRSNTTASFIRTHEVLKEVLKLVPTMRETQDVNGVISYVDTITGSYISTLGGNAWSVTNPLIEYLHATYVRLNAAEQIRSGLKTLNASENAESNLSFKISYSVARRVTSLDH